MSTAVYMIAPQNDVPRAPLRPSEPIVRNPLSDPLSPTPSRVLNSQLLQEEGDLRDIIEEFIDGLPKQLDALRQAYARLDWDAMRGLAHRLKGAGGSYGYPELSEVGAAMETAFREHQAEEFAAWAQRVDELIAAAKAGLREP